MPQSPRIVVIPVGSARALTQQDLYGMFVEAGGRPSKIPT